uniref:Uncharacterized protein n=1 Tax=Leersia perrieri TaxID=77586 RepID=A0A0D9XF57_9ORYZ
MPRPRDRKIFREGSEFQTTPGLAAREKRKRRPRNLSRRLVDPRGRRRRRRRRHKIHIT